MERPLASILINNYNYGRYLREAIDSALRQTEANVEVIVVDDGSTDDSADVIASYGTRIVPLFQRNAGQAAAFNAGFAASRGEIVMFLDADDRFKPNKVAAVLARYREHPEISWCFHSLELFGTNDIPVDDGPRLEDSLVDARYAMRRGKLTVRGVATSGLTFRRALLDRILPMPSDIRITSDNFLKFAAFANGAGAILAEPLAEQRIHASNAYTRRTDVGALRGRIAMQTARHLAERFPAIRRFANGHFAHGVGALVASAALNAEARADVADYLSALPFGERAPLFARLCYSTVRGLGRRWTQ